MHLLSLVADRLWLVKDGHVAPYEHDLETYRASLLTTAPPKEKAAKPKKKVSQADLKDLKAEVKRAEARVAKIEEMRDKLAKKLADPKLYEDDNADSLQVWQAKYAEVSEGLERAEALWMKAEEKLEKAVNA